MKVYLFIISFLFVSCDFIENKPDQVLARLGDEFYYTSDLMEVFPTGLNEEDSVIFVKNRIDDWAKEKLLFKKALVNLGDEKQENLNQLIESYKNELFSYAYQEKIVKSAMDTFIWSLGLAEKRAMNQEAKRNLKEYRFEVSRILRELAEELPSPRSSEDVA